MSSSDQKKQEDVQRASEKIRTMKKPTKPKNMFLRFSTAERSNVKEWLSQHHTEEMLKYGSSTARAKDVAHELGRRWKTLTKEQRDAFKGDYDAEVLAYEKEIKEYRQLKKIVDTYEQNKQIEAGTLKPIKPHVPFMRYTRFAYEPCRASLESKGVPCAPRDVAKVLGHQWSDLDDESKKRFTVPYQIERGEYLRRLEMFRKRYGSNPPEDSNKKKKRKRNSKKKIKKPAAGGVVHTQRSMFNHTAAMSHAVPAHHAQVYQAHAVQGIISYQYPHANVLLAAAKPVMVNVPSVDEGALKRPKRKEKRKYRTDPNRPKVSRCRCFECYSVERCSFGRVLIVVIFSHLNLFSFLAFFLICLLVATPKMCSFHFIFFSPRTTFISGSARAIGRQCGSSFRLRMVTPTRRARRRHARLQRGWAKCGRVSRKRTRRRSKLNLASRTACIWKSSECTRSSSR
jgi:hypothetical protein